jgi:hypothetical protein
MANERKEMLVMVGEVRLLRRIEDRILGQDLTPHHTYIDIFMIEVRKW